MAAGGGAKGEKGGRQPDEGERRRALQPRGITGVNLRSETSDGRMLLIKLALKIDKFALNIDKLAPITLH